MTFWQFLGVVLISAALFAAILGAFVTYAVRKNREATRQFIRGMEERMSRHPDKRADDRHREVIEMISALKTT